MNRREALAALVALPATARISVATLKTTDTIVVECDDILSDDARRNIRSRVQSVFPDREIIVFDKGLRMKIVEGVHS